MKRNYLWGLVGLLVGLFVALVALLAQSGDPEIMQGGATPTPIPVPLGSVLLKYEDPIQNIPAQELTFRKVFQDALWWRVNDPETDQDTRARCFGLISLVNGDIGHATALQPDDLEILMESVRVVWGPGVVDAIEEQIGLR
jgi:hypothetical protein